MQGIIIPRISFLGLLFVHEFFDTYVCMLKRHLDWGGMWYFSSSEILENINFWFPAAQKEKSSQLE